MLGLITVPISVGYVIFIQFRGLPAGLAWLGVPSGSPLAILLHCVSAATMFGTAGPGCLLGATANVWWHSLCSLPIHQFDNQLRARLVQSLAASTQLEERTVYQEHLLLRLVGASFSRLRGGAIVSEVVILVVGLYAMVFTVLTTEPKLNPFMTLSIAGFGVLLVITLLPVAEINAGHRAVARTAVEFQCRALAAGEAPLAAQLKRFLASMRGDGTPMLMIGTLAVSTTTITTFLSALASVAWLVVGPHMDAL